VETVVVGQVCVVCVSSRSFSARPTPVGAVGGRCSGARPCAPAKRFDLFESRRTKEFAMIVSFLSLPPAPCIVARRPSNHATVVVHQRARAGMRGCCRYNGEA